MNHPVNRETPEAVVEAAWQDLLEEARGLPYDWAGTHRQLVEAAAADPRLRALYPFTSHWALRFSTTTRPRLTPLGPAAWACSDGTFGVGDGSPTADLGTYATALEAVAQAVRHLPDGIGPVGFGER